MKTRHALLAVLLVTTALPAWAAGSETTQLIEKAREAQRQGDSRTAIIHLKNAVRKDPHNGESRFELGMVHLRTGDYPGAEKELRQAREANFDVARVLPPLSYAYLMQGKYRQLLGDVENCPGNADCQSAVLAARARAQLALGNQADAEKEAEAAIQAAPNNPEGHVARAIAALAAQNLSAAESQIDEALATKPNHSEALAVKGEIRRLANDPEGAITALKAAVEANSRDMTSRQKLAMMLLAVDRHDEAGEQAAEVLKLNPKSVAAIYVKAALEVRAGRMAEALELVRPLEPEIAKLSTGNYLLALIHGANGNMERALDAADRYQNANPDSIPAAKLAARLYSQRGESDRVVRLLMPFRDRLLDDNGGLALLQSGLLAEGRTAEMQELMATIASRHPDDSATKARMAFLKSGETSQRELGLRQLQDIAERDPSDATAGLMLVMGRLSAGEFQQAIDAAKAMAAAQPKAPLPLHLSASARLAMGDEAGARTDFQAALNNAPDFVPSALGLSEMDVRAGHGAEARARLDAIVKRQPKAVNALMARARIETRAGSPAQAVPFLERAIAAAPDNGDARSQLVVALMEAGDKPRAAAAAADLIRAQPRNPAALELAGQAQIALGKREDALATYQQLARLAPDRDGLLHRLAQVQMGFDMMPEAKASLDKVLALNPANVTAWRDRVEIERRMAGTDAALKLAKTVRTKAPADPSAALLEGDVAALSAKPAEAEAAWREAQAKLPSTYGAQRLYRAALKRGDRAEARKVLTDWLNRSPDDAAGRLILADDLLVTGDFKAAAVHYERLAVKLPLSAAVFNNLAWSYQKLGDARALPTAQRAFGLAPASPEIVDTYATMLYRKGERDRGATLIQQAFTKEPNNPAIAFHMAEVLADRKDIAAALKVLKPVIETKANFDESTNARELYHRLGGQ
ncbi:MAG: PEP-CTERM system TPR-repeat protein PrsT [Rhodospirillaceae bacterium]|nr:PEP-CTERM system TPR-repeat protein PrsT [Rhodospirillales bacterium]